MEHHPPKHGWRSIPYTYVYEPGYTPCLKPLCFIGWYDTYIIIECRQVKTRMNSNCNVKLNCKSTYSIPIQLICGWFRVLLLKRSIFNFSGYVSRTAMLVEREQKLKVNRHIPWIKFPLISHEFPINFPWKYGFLPMTSWFTEKNMFTSRRLQVLTAPFR